MVSLSRDTRSILDSNARVHAYVPYNLASASAGETLDLIALRTAFFTGVGFFAFFATGFFFTTGFFTTGFFLPSSANGFVEDSKRRSVGLLRRRFRGRLLDGRLLGRRLLRRGRRSLGQGGVHLHRARRVCGCDDRGETTRDGARGRGGDGFF